MSNKRNLVLYVNAELVEKTRDLGFNLSKTFANYMQHLLTQYSALNTINTSETIVELGSPGEIRALVSGSRAQVIQDSLCIEDVDKTVGDFWEYLKVEERLSKKVSKDYKNVARRLLISSNGEVSRQAVREFLSFYVSKAPRTYNNIIDALKAFIGRYLKRQDLVDGLKHTYVPATYERPLPTKEQMRKGFEALDTDKERAIYLFYATTGLRRSEALSLTMDDIDFGKRVELFQYLMAS